MSVRDVMVEKDVEAFAPGGSASRACCGVWVADWAAHIPKPMLDCPPHSTTSPTATSARVATAVPSVATRVADCAAAMAGITTVQLPPGPAAAVPLAVHVAAVNVTVTALCGVAPVPHTRVPCPRCSTMPSPKSGWPNANANVVAAVGVGVGEAAMVTVPVTTVIKNSTAAASGYGILA